MSILASTCCNDFHTFKTLIINLKLLPQLTYKISTIKAAASPLNYAKFIATNFFSNNL